MENKYCYVSVIYENNISKKRYYYISNLPKIKINDKVLVNCAGEKVEGRVVDVKYYNKEDVPYPIYKTKKILKLLNQEENSVTKYNEVNKVEKNTTLNDDNLNILLNEESNYDNYSDNIEDEDSNVDKIVKDNKKLITIALSLIVTMVVICIVIFNFNTNNSSSTNVLNITKQSSSNNSSNGINKGSNSSSSKSSKSSSSSYSSSSSSKTYDPRKDPDVTYYSGYRKSKGVNGAVTYYCTRCNYSYQYSKGRDRGWFGCPQCGDITYKEFYDKAYPNS